MDIFTTQLTRVVPARLKPAKLKVKGLVKDAKSRALDEEQDHLDDHERNTITQQYGQAHYQQELAKQKENISTEEEGKSNPYANIANLDTEHILPSEHPSLEKSELMKNAKPHEKSSDSDKDKDDKEHPPHLDIFV